MLHKKWIRVASLLLCMCAFTGVGHSENKIQQYLNDAARSAKVMADPAQKRAILDEQYQALSHAMNILIESPVVASADRAGLKHHRALIDDMRDELAGRNGYARIADHRIDDFARYVVQELEQADTVIVISGVTLLLLLILIVLIVR